MSCFAFHSELSFNSFDVDLKVKLAHTADDHLFRLFIHIHVKSRVFSYEFRKGLFKLSGSVRLSGLDCETHDWVRHEHALAASRVAVIGDRESVTSGALDPKNSKYVSGLNFINLLHIVGMHFNYSRHFEFFG